jgi:hypothetical protein
VISALSGWPETDEVGREIIPAGCGRPARTVPPATIGRPAVSDLAGQVAQHRYGRAS